eukprot:861478-Pelagomonas_calceolata.AAC.2
MPCAATSYKYVHQDTQQAMRSRAVCVYYASHCRLLRECASYLKLRPYSLLPGANVRFKTAAATCCSSAFAAQQILEADATRKQKARLLAPALKCKLYSAYVQFPEADATYYVAPCYPYTYSDLQEYLDRLTARLSTPGPPPSTTLSAPLPQFDQHQHHQQQIQRQQQHQQQQQQQFLRPLEVSSLQLRPRSPYLNPAVPNPSTSPLEGSPVPPLGGMLVLVSARALPPVLRSLPCFTLFGGAWCWCVASCTTYTFALVQSVAFDRGLSVLDGMSAYACKRVRAHVWVRVSVCMGVGVGVVALAGVSICVTLRCAHACIAHALKWIVAFWTKRNFCAYAWSHVNLHQDEDATWSSPIYDALQDEDRDTT